jgi:hypothetical protein
MSEIAAIGFADLIKKLQLIAGLKPCSHVMTLPQCVPYGMPAIVASIQTTALMIFGWN